MYKKLKRSAAAGKRNPTDKRKQRGNSNSKKKRSTSFTIVKDTAATTQLKTKPGTPTLRNKKKKKPFSSKKVKSSSGDSKVPSEGITSKKRKLECDESGKPLKKCKLFEMKKKDRKIVRQEKEKKNFTLWKKLKSLWEELRPFYKKPNVDDPKKTLLLNQTSEIIKGHATELIFSHGPVRIIEFLVDEGTDDHRTLLFEELKESIITIANSKYAKFFLKKMLKHGAKEQKSFILQQFTGKVIQMLCHAEASTVVEAAFNDCANALQRRNMIQEFYGPYYKFFKDSESSSLVDILNKNPDKKNNIMEHIQQVMENMIRKVAHKHSIVHCVLNEFMNNADEKARSAMIEIVRTCVVEMLHTRDGSRVAMNCVWHGTRKDRKAIVKSFKGHVAKIAQEEFGCRVLLAVFDCVDDTKFIERYIIKEISEQAKTISQSIYGKKVMLYLVSPRNPVYFHPDVINILKQGDNNETSKKDEHLRKSELHNAAAPMLMQVITENFPDNLKDNGFCLFTSLILNNVQVDVKDAFMCIAELATELDYFPPDTEDNEIHFIEQVSSSLLMKKLILKDGERKLKGHATFSGCVIELAPTNRLSTWIHCNRGCFLLVNLLDTKEECVVNRVKKDLLSRLELIDSKVYQGAKLLSKKLKETTETETS